MKKKKKIIHIVESWGSGVFSFIVDLVNKTHEEYEIIILHGKREETFENYEDYFPKDVKLVHIKNFTRSISPLKDIKAFLEIRKIIKNEKPDIVHLHSSKAGFLGRFAVNTKKIKVLYNPHGFAFLARDISKSKSKLFMIAEKIAAKRNCTIICCSNGEYEEALKFTKNTICINNGIDIDALQEISNDIKEKKIDFNNLKICTVGRTSAQKNPKLFNDIAASLPEYKFTWIGGGKEDELLTSSNITVTGWLSTKEDALKILNENDIFILTSLWEGLPLSLLEAMYFKKICIVSDCIGNRDVIRNGENGFICKNKEEFVETIKRIKDADLKAIKDTALKDIEQTYNLNVMSNEYRKVYNQ